MKHLIVINGTMGVGKTAAAGELKNLLDRSVLLDGDWCWDMHPFSVTEETKAMVLDNISHLLKNFLECSQFKYVIFCWVMHQEQICRDILERLNGEYELFRFTLTCPENVLRERLQKDVEAGLRLPDVIERSVERLACYGGMNTVKIETGELSAAQAAEQIAEIVKGRQRNDQRSCKKKPQLPRL